MGSDRAYSIVHRIDRQPDVVTFSVMDEEWRTIDLCEEDIDGFPRASVRLVESGRLRIADALEPSYQAHCVKSLLVPRLESILSNFDLAGT